MKCSNCGNIVPDGEKFCEKCGSKIESINSENNQNTKYCRKCGEPLKSDSEFCPKCGSHITDENGGGNVSSNNHNTKYCVNCGSIIDINAELCPKCGVRQNLNATNKTIKHCVNCGAEIDIKAEICPKCGVRQISHTPTSSDKNTFIAMALSFILPGLGHFYLGLSKKGIILLILGLLLSPSLLYGVGIVYLIVWGYGLYDSYKQSEALSLGDYVEDW